MSIEFCHTKFLPNKFYSRPPTILLPKTEAHNSHSHRRFSVTLLFCIRQWIYLLTFILYSGLLARVNPNVFCLICSQAMDSETALLCPSENFFDRLKFYSKQFSSIDVFILALDNYIHYYNNIRISLKLKGMSPVQY